MFYCWLCRLSVFLCEDNIYETSRFFRAPKYYERIMFAYTSRPSPMMTLIKPAYKKTT
nr:MAG TPA: hypothetical protein [Caudoviricetes sp.]